MPCNARYDLIEAAETGSISASHPPIFGFDSGIASIESAYQAALGASDKVDVGVDAMDKF